MYLLRKWFLHKISIYVPIEGVKKKALWHKKRQLDALSDLGPDLGQIYSDPQLVGRGPEAGRWPDFSGQTSVKKKLLFLRELLKQVFPLRREHYK